MFENYSGTLTSNAEVIGFKDIVFKKNTALAFAGAWINNSNSYNVDISRRSIDYADTLIMSGIPTPSIINLTISETTSLSDLWKIADGISSMPTINVVYHGATIATKTAVNDAISGSNTPFDGWGFDIVGGVLRFKRL